MGVISQDTVKQVANLARLRLDGRELTEIAAQLDEILGYVAQLQSVSTEGVSPTSHVLPLSNVLRKDSPGISISQGEVLNLSPAKKPPFVKVPKVIET